MNKIKIIVLSLALMLGVAAVATPAYVGASAKSEINKGINSTGTQTGGKKLDTTIKTIVNVMLFIIGALSVIMIIVGGIRYVTSTGDSSRVKAAKDTVMYAVVGLLVALFAYAIVNFVVDKLG